MVITDLNTIVVPAMVPTVPVCADCEEAPSVYRVVDGRRVCGDCVKGYCVRCGGYDAIYTDNAMESQDPEGFCNSCLWDHAIASWSSRPMRRKR